jgi:hypothetical protein
VARRHGAYYLVAGWVLTAPDLEALGIPVAGVGAWPETRPRAAGGAEAGSGRAHDL